MYMHTLYTHNVYGVSVWLHAGISILIAPIHFPVENALYSFRSRRDVN